MTFDPNLPIIIGLTGPAGSGKTVTAMGLAPPARVLVKPNEDNVSEKLIFDHAYFALPLYRMATARQRIEGHRRLDRIYYEIFDTMQDLLGGSVLFGSLPPFDEFVNIVKHISSGIPCDRDTKPRSFLQQVGSICRSYDEDCFVKWMDRLIDRNFRETRQEDPEARYVMILSDIRFRNEAELVASSPNGMLIRLNASEEVLRERIYNRDGVYLSTEQAQHESEQSFSLIPEDWYYAEVDSTAMTKAEQVKAVRDIITARL